MKKIILIILCFSQSIYANVLTKNEGTDIEVFCFCQQNGKTVSMAHNLGKKWYLPKSADKVSKYFYKSIDRYKLYPGIKKMHQKSLREKKLDKNMLDIFEKNLKHGWHEYYYTNRFLCLAFKEITEETKKYERPSTCQELYDKVDKRILE